MKTHTVEREREREREREIERKRESVCVCTYLFLVRESVYVFIPRKETTYLRLLYNRFVFCLFVNFVFFFLFVCFK